MTNVGIYGVAIANDDVIYGRFGKTPAGWRGSMVAPATVANGDGHLWESMAMTREEIAEKSNC